MTVAFTNLTSGSDTDGNSSATTASVTITSNRLALLSVVQFEANGADSVSPTCSGWTEVHSVQFYSASVLRARLTVLRQLGSGGTGTHTINFSASQAEVRWSIDQSDANVDTGGTNGSAAVIQATSNSATSTTSVSTTLAAFGSTNNGTFGSMGTYGGGVSTMTVGTGFTALANNPGGFSTDTSQLTEYRTDNDTTVDGSVDTSVDALGIIGIEVKAAAGGTYTIVAEQGSYTLTGQDLGLLYPRTMTAEQGSYSLTGQNTNLNYNAAITMAAEYGLYTLVGSNALVDVSMNAEQGSYTLTGQAATLTYTQLNNFSIVADQGSYVLTGQATNLLFGSRLVAGQGSYTLNGIQVGLVYSGAVSSGYSSQRMTFSRIKIGL